jgi:hypothetical protein
MEGYWCFPSYLTGQQNIFCHKDSKVSIGRNLKQEVFSNLLSMVLQFHTNFNYCIISYIPRPRVRQQQNEV